MLLRLDRGIEKQELYTSILHRAYFKYSAVGVATGYGLENRGFEVRVTVGPRIFSSLYNPDWL
jgi:hypothetical protein